MNMDLVSANYTSDIYIVILLKSSSPSTPLKLPIDYDYVNCVDL